VPLILLGLGNVGRALLSRIRAGRAHHRKRYGLEFAIEAVSDSSGAVRLGNRPPANDELDAILRHKEAGRSLAEAREFEGPIELEELVRQLCRPGCIVVDCTASCETVWILREALARGGSIVLANKKPLTQEQEIYAELTAWPGRCRWETTVASNLPVISVLNRIVATGDEVHRIMGTVSGTLGFVMFGLQEGRNFSELVREAFESGATEPDPREDLGGMDVARKALILARGLGWQLELSNVQVQGLIPSSCREISVDTFLGSAESLDEQYQNLVEAALARGATLRYVVTIEDASCRVGVEEVALQSPLGRLKGNDNLVQIHSSIFSPTPLILQGRGSGVEATASGILSDILELVLASARSSLVRSRI
jgi:aspartokinase/homoserine dehydrogenase 1